jgi:hypothetical protein
MAAVGEANASVMAAVGEANASVMAGDEFRRCCAK